MAEIIFRKQKIVELCKEKTVLHLGFLEHELWTKKEAAQDWLHAQINKVAKELVGLDYLEEEIQKVKQKYDYEVYQADVTKLEDLKLEKKFDVLVCGELIEHIENPGLMLDGIKKFMHQDSILIITSPNPWRTKWVENMQKGVLEEKWLNKEHVAWYSFQTLKQLLTRKGFAEIYYGYYYSELVMKVVKGSGLLFGLRKIKSWLWGYYLEAKKRPESYEGLFFIAKRRSGR
jgi:hypothetical protein